MAMRIGDRDAVGIDRRLRLDRKILHIAVDQPDDGWFRISSPRWWWRHNWSDGTSAPLTTRPCEALLPEPPAKAFNNPDVPPEAAALNWSSVTSMVQAPLPTGMPASVAS